MAQTKEIKAQILHRIPTPNGPITHGIQFDVGTHNSNIVCLLCQNQEKQHFSKTLHDHAGHILKEHSEIFKKIVERKLTN